MPTWKRWLLRTPLITVVAGVVVAMLCDRTGRYILAVGVCVFTVWLAAMMFVYSMEDDK